MSRVDLTPLATTATGLLPSSTRSADMSKVVATSRWTPPSPKQKSQLVLSNFFVKIRVEIPPVPITRIPAPLATTRVPAIVVPPLSFLDKTWPKSLRDVFTAGCLAVSARYSSSCPLRPTFTIPSRIAMVAGTAPYKIRNCTKLRNRVAEFIRFISMCCVPKYLRDLRK